ncbi:MAG TPA: hypothetical protein VMN39_10825 [Longimicrobiaceae bacterium]|nr:hypothetical protein [Longimicrobiaceae bacterium]
MSDTPSLDGFFRVCVKLYSPEPKGIESDAAAFVPIFHEWIREGTLDLVLFDVADYAHAPDSPGIMLVTHEASFALDRSDGRFGLFVQRRTPIEGDAVHAIAATLRHAIQVACMLERDPRLEGRLKFDAARPRIEANDRLRVPNTDEGFRTFAPAVQAALGAVYPGREIRIARVENDPRDRLTLDVRVAAEQGAGSELAA